MQEAFVMLHILEHTLSHTIEDSVKLLPFLFFTYLLMELLEHTTGGKVQNTRGFPQTGNNRVVRKSQSPVFVPVLCPVNAVINVY